MAKIDIDKLVNFFLKSKFMYTAAITPMELSSALKNQGLEYKDGEIRSIPKEIAAPTTGFWSNDSSKNIPNADAFIQVMTGKFKNELLENSYTSLGYIPVNGLAAAYKQGLEDMYRKLKEEMI